MVASRPRLRICDRCRGTDIGLPGCQWGVGGSGCFTGKLAVLHAVAAGSQLSSYRSASARDPGLSLSGQARRAPPGRLTDRPLRLRFSLGLVTASSRGSRRPNRGGRCGDSHDADAAVLSIVNQVATFKFNKMASGLGGLIAKIAVHADEVEEMF